jgi:tRNA pseudouridine55 synthase
MALFGILNVNKPSGLTSRDMVDRVELLTRPEKTGHAGTLDPLASGVLVICVGQATRLIRYVQQMPKRYRTTFLLGRQSETDDIEGEVTEIAGAAEPARGTLDLALAQFVGVIEQRPPAHSAIKIAGRRAYKLARKGKQVELAARPVAIHSLEVLRYDYPELELSIECGSGTYVRALGRDLGIAMGSGAVMSALVRTAIGKFSIDDAVALDGLNTESLTQRLQSPLSALPDLPRIELTSDQIEEVRNGRSIRIRAGQLDNPSVLKSSEFAAIDGEGQLVGILFEKRHGQLWPAMNFM